MGPGQPKVSLHDDFVPTDELIRIQGVKPFTSLDDLAADDPFSSDEEYADFLADLYTSRHADGS
jgi:hypothetical protein